jgi:hypothetical protein
VRLQYSDPFRWPPLVMHLYFILCIAEDFRRMLLELGCRDFRIVSRTPITVDDAGIALKVPSPFCFFHNSALPFSSFCTHSYVSTVVVRWATPSSSL